MIDWTRTIFWTGYLFLAVVLVIMGIALRTANANVQSDAYALSHWNSYEDYRARLLTLDFMPCASVTFSDGVTPDKARHDITRVYVPAGINRFFIYCEGEKTIVDRLEKWLEEREAK